MITNPNEYRYRCPDGHVTVKRISTNKRNAAIYTPAYYCGTCKKTYQGKPIDTLIDPDDEGESWEGCYVENRIKIY